MKLGSDGNHGFIMCHLVPVGTPGSSTDPNDGINWTRAGHYIHVRKKEMLKDPDQGVISLIHGSSHKFANTWDFDNRGYREEDDSDWQQPGLTTAEALQNADNYAFFAFRAGSANSW